MKKILLLILFALIVSVESIFAVDPNYGIYSLANPNVAPSTSVLSMPDVDGIAVRASWDKLEPSRGVFNFSFIDAQVAAAANAGKKISLDISAGRLTPSWYFGPGISSFTYINTSSSLSSFCKEDRIPVPWDNNFLTTWGEFVTALGNRYNSDPTVTHVRITGENGPTSETSLPKSTGGYVSNSSTGCFTSNDILDWQNAGYTRIKAETAWQTIAGQFSAAFPNKRIVVDLYDKSMPPIDSNGNAIPGRGDTQFSNDVISYGISHFGQQFAAETDGLKNTYIWTTITAVATQTMTGYQMAWYVTGDTTYRMNNGVPGDPHTVLQGAVIKGIQGGAKFLEIYEKDVLNPVLADVIHSAHSFPLNQPPVVNAGNNQTITLPHSASLNGTVTDDGLPNPPGTVAVTWSKVSGSGNVTFGNANSKATSATFSKAGTYVLALKANDSFLSSTSNVTITVNKSHR